MEQNPFGMYHLVAILGSDLNASLLCIALSSKNNRNQKQRKAKVEPSDNVAPRRETPLHRGELPWQNLTAKCDGTTLPELGISC